MPEVWAMRAGAAAHRPWRGPALRVMRALVLAAGGLSLGGCALLYNPVSQSVPVTSAPTGAEVWIDGEFVGTTPVTVELNARSTHHVEVKSGGQSKAWFLEPQWTPGSTLGAAGDGLLLVAGGGLGVFTLAFSSSGGGPVFPISDGLVSSVWGVVLIGAGFSPLVVDLATGSFHAVSAAKLEVTFQ